MGRVNHQLFMNGDEWAAAEELLACAEPFVIGPPVFVLLLMIECLFRRGWWFLPLGRWWCWGWSSGDGVVCVSLFISCSFRFFLRHRDLRRLIQSCFMLFMLLCYFLLSVSIFRSMCFLSLFFYLLQPPISFPLSTSVSSLSSGLVSCYSWSYSSLFYQFPYLVFCMYFYPLSPAASYTFFFFIIIVFIWSGFVLFLLLFFSLVSVSIFVPFFFNLQSSNASSVIFFFPCQFPVFYLSHIVQPLLMCSSSIFAVIIIFVLLWCMFL